MRIRVVVGLLLASCLFSPASASEVVNLDVFIAGIEKGGSDGCRPKGPLAEFVRRLGERYSFEQGSRRRAEMIRIQEPFKPAIGKAQADNRKQFTVIRVPLIGRYRGLPTREITFFVGHSNGVNATHILFDATKEEVERVIGGDVAQVRQAFAADEIARDFGFRAEIVAKNRRASLVCDTSA